MSRFSVIPACFMIFRRPGEVLLIERQNTGYMNGWWDVPAGHVEPGETALEGAIREAKEEVGVEIDLDSIQMTGVTYWGAEDESNTRVNFYFETSKWKGDIINAEADKHGEPTWFLLSNLPDKLLEHTKQVILGEAVTTGYYECPQVN